MKDPRSSASYPVHPAPIYYRDLEPAQAAVVRAYGDFSLELVGDIRRFEWRTTAVQLGPIAVIASSCSTGAIVRGEPASYIITLTAPRDPARTAARGPGDLAFGDLTVFSPASRCQWSASGPFEGIRVRIDPSFLHGQLEAFTGATPLQPVQFAQEISTGVGAGSFLKMLCLLLAGATESGEASLDHPLLRSSFCETLARSLLLGQFNNHSHLLAKPARQASPRAVRLVEEYLTAQAAEPVGMAELVTLTGESGRAIEAAFQAHRGTTPGAFLRKERLERARRRLLHHESAASTTERAHDAGFLRPEQFGAAYIARFGESPVEPRRGGPAVRIAELSPREREVCELAARGMLNKQIAAELAITERTVKHHRAAAMKRLGATSAAELGSLFAHPLRR